MMPLVRANRTHRSDALVPVSLLGLSALLVLLAGAAPAATHSRARASRAHEVRMVGGSDHARFEPSEVTVQPGDSVVFVVASGQPHNVAFDTAGLTAPQKQALRTLVHDPMLPFAGPLLLKEGDRYAMSTTGLPAGSYPFFCMTHVALDMRGTMVVR